MWLGNANNPKISKERKVSKMALVTTKEMFEKAYNGGYAIGAFNVNNMEIVQGITEAAKEVNAPLILQVSKGARAYANHTYLVKLVEAAVIECPVKDSLLFLDYINEGDGGMVELPFVRTLEEFLDRLENSPYKFAANNVYVVFDGEGNLVTIHRYYVPWG